MTRQDRVELLGCPFDRVTMQSAIDRCLEWCVGPRAAHTVVTMNAALLCMMRRDPELRAACRGGDLIVPDGMPVVWTSRLAGVPLPERVAGVDLMARLLRAGSERRTRASTSSAPARRWSTSWCGAARATTPGSRVAGSRDGYFGPDDHASIVAEIRERSPHMLFVGHAEPLQGDVVRAAPRSAGRAGDHGRRRQLRRADRIRPSRAAPAPVGGHGVGLATGDGAAQDVEALPRDEHRVPLAGGTGDPRRRAGRARGADRKRKRSGTDDLRKTVDVFMGTRPEAIKMAPVVAALEESSRSSRAA